MAVLTATDRALLRDDARRGQVTAAAYAKATLDAASQAVEDYFTANAGAISTAINTATSPLVLTAAQKKTLVAVYCYRKAFKDGVTP